MQAYPMDRWSTSCACEEICSRYAEKLHIMQRNAGVRMKLSTFSNLVQDAERERSKHHIVAIDITNLIVPE